jgi:hypothetical protein
LQTTRYITNTGDNSVELVYHILSPTLLTTLKKLNEIEEATFDNYADLVYALKIEERRLRAKERRANARASEEEERREQEFEWQQREEEKKAKELALERKRVEIHASLTRKENGKVLLGKAKSMSVRNEGDSDDSGSDDDGKDDADDPGLLEKSKSATERESADDTLKGKIWSIITAPSCRLLNGVTYNMQDIDKLVVRCDSYAKLTHIIHELIDLHKGFKIKTFKSFGAFLKEVKFRVQRDEVMTYLNGDEVTVFHLPKGQVAITVTPSDCDQLMQVGFKHARFWQSLSIISCICYQTLTNSTTRSFFPFIF